LINSSSNEVDFRQRHRLSMSRDRQNLQRSLRQTLPRRDAVVIPEKLIE
jgi:hypothetical protein